MLKFALFIFILSSIQCRESSYKRDELNTHIKLDMSPPVLVGCGGFQLAYGFIYKNEIDSSIVCIIRCPYEYGEGFFKKDSFYQVKLSSININDSLKDYVVENPFKDDKIQTYLITEIIKAP